MKWRATFLCLQNNWRVRLWILPNKICRCCYVEPSRDTRLPLSHYAKYLFKKQFKIWRNVREKFALKSNNNNRFWSVAREMQSDGAKEIKYSSGFLLKNWRRSTTVPSETRGCRMVTMRIPHVLPRLPRPYSVTQSIGFRVSNVTQQIRFKWNCIWQRTRPCATCARLTTSAN